jgi:hypothetical protein
MLGESLAMYAAHTAGGDCDGGTIVWQALAARHAYALCGKHATYADFWMLQKINARTVGTLPNRNMRAGRLFGRKCGNLPQDVGPLGHFEWLARWRGNPAFALRSDRLCCS